MTGLVATKDNRIQELEAYRETCETDAKELKSLLKQLNRTFGVAKDASKKRKRDEQPQQVRRKSPKSSPKSSGSQEGVSAWLSNYSRPLDRRSSNGSRGEYK